MSLLLYTCITATILHSSLHRLGLLYNYVIIVNTLYFVLQAGPMANVMIFVKTINDVLYNNFLPSFSIIWLHSKSYDNFNRTWFVII